MTRISQAQPSNIEASIRPFPEAPDRAPGEAQAASHMHDASRHEAPSATDLLDHIERQLQEDSAVDRGAAELPRPTPQQTMLGLVRRCRSKFENAERAMRTLKSRDAMAVRNPLFRWVRNLEQDIANCNVARDEALDAIAIASSRLFPDMDELGFERTRSIAATLREMLKVLSGPPPVGGANQTGCSERGGASEAAFAKRIANLDQRLNGVAELSTQRLPATFASPSIVRGIFQPAGVSHIEANIASLLDRRSLAALAQVSVLHANLAKAEKRLRLAHVDTLRSLLKSPEGAREVFNDEQALAKLAEAESLVLRPNGTGHKLFSSWGSVVGNHPDGSWAGVVSLFSNRAFMLSLCQSPKFEDIQSCFMQGCWVIPGFRDALRRILPTLTVGPGALPEDHPSMKCIADLIASTG